MSHARKIAAALYPGAACHEAQSYRRCVGPGRFVNSREDLFGIADLTLLFRGDLILVQVTSENGSVERRARLKRWWEAHRSHIPAGSDLLVWGWRPRKHMRRWQLDPTTGTWQRIASLKANGEPVP